MGNYTTELQDKEVLCTFEAAGSVVKLTNP